ncbi:MAG: carboxymuconolactone decarboxylase family protein [Methanocellales archaeon]
MNERILKKLEKKWGKIPTPIKVLNAGNPKTVSLYLAFRKELLKGGVLPPKIKRLVLIACAATVKCKYCLEMHIREALIEGISEQEILEAISLAYLIGGGPAMATGTRALDIFEST